MQKISYLAEEKAFAQALKKVVTDNRDVFRVDKPDQKVTLNPNNPKKSLDYYYQIRSNITHRGKAVVRDHDRVKASLSELLQIFQYVLEKGFEESV